MEPEKQEQENLAKDPEKPQDKKKNQKETQNKKRNTWYLHSFFC